MTPGKALRIKAGRCTRRVRMVYRFYTLRTGTLKTRKPRLSLRKPRPEGPDSSIGLPDCLSRNT